MPDPLRGVRVVDLTSVAFGPYCTQTLGDLGADVVKVESPAGDTTRTTGPARSPGMAALFLGVNRNKRSIVLDLKQPAAREALWRLVEAADVFVHSIRPQKIEKLGFGHEAVLARNPRIVYLALHGYRADGPYAGLPAYDDVIQGRSGTADLMARITGEPRYTPTIIADKTVALFATYAVCAALFERERTGAGQHVEVPMLECMTAFNMVEHLFGATFDPPIGPMGYGRVLAHWRRPYRTRDGHVSMLAYTDAQWQRFWAEVGRPDLAADPRFDRLKTRSENIDELYRIAGEKMADRTTAQWLEALQRIDVPAARVNAIEDLASDEHLAATGFFRSYDHPTEGTVVVPDAPVRFSGQASPLERPHPRLGEHSVEVLQEVGFDDAEIRGMLESEATIAAG